MKDFRSWESFESFCCDLLNHLHPERPFGHYGKRGDTQHGIDLLGRGQDGTLWVAQCKKYERFTSRHAKEALEAMSFKADRYLLLISDEATAGVRDVIHEVPSWELWDVRDISRQVRDLPPHKARKLVEHHFGPDWRKHFLGLSGDSNLLAPPFPLERSRPEFLLELAGNAHAASFLQTLLHQMPGASVPQRRWLALLFNALSSDCSSPLSLAVIQEQAHTAEASTLDSLASVLSHASVDFILNQFELTCALIERARACGEPCSKNLNDKLINRAVRGLGEGDWRSPLPRGEERRERAIALRSRLHLGSPAWPFYTQFSEELSEQQ